MKADQVPDCATIRDLAPDFVLGTLDEETAAYVRAHLVDCPDAHAEIAELGGVLPYLAESLDPVEPRSELRGRLMAAARASRPMPAAVRSTASGSPETVARAFRSRLGLLTPRLAWGLAAAAVVVVAALGAVTFSLRAQLDESERLAAALRRALTAASEPGALVAFLRGSDQAPGVSGLAVVTRDGGTLVLEGLPPAPGDRYYEAWYIAGATPRSAGRLDVQPDGTGLLSGPSESGPIDQVAVTLEPVDGGPEPDGPFYATGIVAANPS